MTAWTAERTQQLRDLWDDGLKRAAIMRVMGLTTGQFTGKTRTLNLHYHGGRAMTLAADHAAVTQGRTLFQKAVRAVNGAAVLKPGIDTRKLGHTVTKGAWKGFPIYSLTLEERATCPRSCAMWRSCYGNHMHMARRWKAGPDLVAKLNEELAGLQARHPRGFVVRLHLLGDFYSLDYVKAWVRFLLNYPALHVFGYTAWPRETEIGAALGKLIDAQWSRFALRHSGACEGPSTTVVTAASDAPAGSIVCPVQTNKTDSCATCGLCWQSQKTVAFLAH